MGNAEDRDDGARLRAREADQRARELADRLARLHSGEPTTEDDVEWAREAAQTSLRRGAQAHERGAEAHRHAAEAHRAAARVAARAGLPERAQEHLAAAQADDEAAEADDALAGADVARADESDSS